MRAVVDTNVWVSAFLTPGGTAAKLLAAMVAGQLTPVLSAPVESEYRSVLARAKFNIEPLLLADFFNDLRTLGQFVDQVPPIDIDLPDPGDAPFVALARHALCPVITGNARHFPARAGVKALTPAAWLAERANQNS